MDGEPTERELSCLGCFKSSIVVVVIAMFTIEFVFDHSIPFNKYLFLFHLTDQTYFDRLVLLSLCLS